MLLSVDSFSLLVFSFRDTMYSMNTQYYVATDGENSQGPYHLTMLKTLYEHDKITGDTLVCAEGGQEWVQFRMILEQEWDEYRKLKPQEKTDQKNMTAGIDNLSTSEKENVYSADGISVVFKLIGSIALIAGIILLVYSIEAKHTGIGFIYLLSSLLSCVACFWCAKVIELLCVLANKK